MNHTEPDTRPIAVLALVLAIYAGMLDHWQQPAHAHLASHGTHQLEDWSVR